MANISKINALPTWGGVQSDFRKEVRGKAIGGDSYGC